MRRKLWYVVAGASGFLALLGPVIIVLQGAAAEGFGIGQALHWNIASEVLGTRFGHVTVARTVLAAALCVFAIFAPRIPAKYRTYEEAALFPAAGLIMIPALSGHASVSGNASFVLDVVHVAAACVWVGGLAFIVMALLLATDGRWPLAMRCVPRFSAAAVISVAALITAGTLNGYLQIRTWDALFNTTYGQLLIAKIALVTPLLLIGLFNNRFVPRLKAGQSTAVQRQRFLRMTGAELAIMALIVGVTAVLVSEPPAKAQAALEKTQVPKGTATIITGPYHLELKVEPGTAGPNDILIEVVHGDPPTEVKVSASLPDQQIGPLDYVAVKSGETEYTVKGADLSDRRHLDAEGERPRGRVRLVRRRGAGRDQVVDGLKVTPSVVIPVGEVELRTSRSSGPGGQHAQKTETRVEAVFDVDASATLSDAQKRRLVTKLGPVVRAIAQDERSQSRNRELALERLEAQLREALKIPRKRRPTKPTKAAKERRLDTKKQRATTKRLRKPPAED